MINFCSVRGSMSGTQRAYGETMSSAAAERVNFVVVGQQAVLTAHLSQLHPVSQSAGVPTVSAPRTLNANSSNSAVPGLSGRSP